MRLLDRRTMAGMVPPQHALVALVGAAQIAVPEIADILFHIAGDAAEIRLDVLLDAACLARRSALGHRMAAGHCDAKRRSDEDVAESDVHGDFFRSSVDVRTVGAEG